MSEPTQQAIDNAIALSRFYDFCQIVQISEDGEDDGFTWFHCNYHGQDTLNEESCQ